MKGTRYPRYSLRKVSFWDLRRANGEYAGMIYSNCALELYGVIHALLLSYRLTILKTSSSSLMKVSAISQMSKKGSLRQ